MSDLIVGATPCERGCGRRKEGGIYAEMGFSAFGWPLEEFLIDPPSPLPPDYPLSARGVKVIERDEAPYLMDWIGQQHYPNVADFVEEVRNYGLSRRLPPNLPFDRITPDSRLLTVHARAWITNTAEYRNWRCPKCFVDHAPGTLQAGLCCAGVWWRDLEGGEPISSASDDGAVLRKMPSFSYYGHARLEGVKAEYLPAVFASFPLSRIVVIKGEGADESLSKLKKAGVPVEEVDA